MRRSLLAERSVPVSRRRLLRFGPSRGPSNPASGQVVIASAEPFREPDGYTISTAIEEVLVDAGFLADERLIESD
jgi:hypothetical protein